MLFHIHAGYPLGYPVLLSSQLNQERLSDLITYLKDAPYLSSTETVALSAELPIYNPQRSVLGYVNVDITWSKAGFIRADPIVACFPAVQYQGNITTENWQGFVADLAMVLICGEYAMCARTASASRAGLF